MENLAREAFATLAEFRRGLENAFPVALTDSPDGLLARHGAAAMLIHLTPGPDRRIAALVLPTLRVRIRFTAGTVAQREGMLAHMDRTMHRGGG